LLADLDRQRQAIAGPIAVHDPDLELKLLWRFLDLAKSLGDRCASSDEGVVFGRGRDGVKEPDPPQPSP